MKFITLFPLAAVILKVLLYIDNDAYPTPAKPSVDQVEGKVYT